MCGHTLCWTGDFCLDRQHFHCMHDCVAGRVGQVVDVETEDGIEKGAVILGLAQAGDAGQMRIKFPDGVVDDWDAE
jgi:hypothetical protein